MSVVMKRNSVREFKQDIISQEKIESLLKAGMQAPSANNQQPWNYIVVTDRALLDKLSEMSHGSWPLATAPLAIIPVIIFHLIIIEFTPIVNKIICVFLK